MWISNKSFGRFENWEENFKKFDLFVKEALYFLFQRPLEVFSFTFVAQKFLELSSTLSIPSDRSGKYWVLGDMLQVWFQKDDLKFQVTDRAIEIGLEPFEEDEFFMAVIRAYFLHNFFIENEEWFSQVFKEGKYRLPENLYSWLQEADLEVHENDLFFWVGAISQN